MSEGNSFAYETVFSTPKRIEDLERARDSGFFIRFFFVSTKDPNINIARVERRVAVGGHDVPTDKIVARYHRSMSNLLQALRIADRGYIYDNSIDNQGYELMFRTEKAQVKKVYQDPMIEWASNTMNALSDVPVTGQKNPSPPAR